MDDRINENVQCNQNNNLVTNEPGQTSVDPFDMLEERFTNLERDQGYKDGFQRGQEDGESEGQQLGEGEGARRGSELGYFRGFALTYKQLLFLNTNRHNETTGDTDRPQPTTTREERLLLDLLKLIEEYPRRNETNCEEKLQNIRVKFRQAFGANETSGVLLSSKIDDSRVPLKLDERVPSELSTAAGGEGGQA